MQKFVLISFIIMFLNSLLKNGSMFDVFIWYRCVQNVSQPADHVSARACVCACVRVFFSFLFVFVFLHLTEELLKSLINLNDSQVPDLSSSIHTVCVAEQRSVDLLRLWPW